MARTRVYRYVGPDDLRTLRRTEQAVHVESMATLDRWLAAQKASDVVDPFTFVVDVSQRLWLAPRRSEHVACAAGADVLAAGEMGFAMVVDRWDVRDVSNQSTGYCPEPESWPAVAAALNRAGVSHPGRYTHEVTFRRCTDCGARNVVREEVFVCALCDSALPDRWNFNT